jgi:hypothetical protein
LAQKTARVLYTRKLKKRNTYLNYLFVRNKK